MNTTNWKELDGKTGTIRYSIDYAFGKDKQVEILAFVDSETGKAYILAEFIEE